MGTVDVIIIVVAVLSGVAGGRRGLVVGALTLAGFVLGVIAGTRVGPELLRAGNESPWAPLFGLFGALLVGLTVAAIAEVVASRVRTVMRGPFLRGLDVTGGAALAVAAGLGMVWIVGAVALQVPATREWRPALRGSVILTELNELLPPSGPILNALSRVDTFPQLAGPIPDGAAPDPAAAGRLGVVEARGSLARITGVACGFGISGSGWVVGEGLVVTNAHVVAGEDETDVRIGGVGEAFAATVVAFDARNDVAILAVPDLRAPALPMVAAPRVGTAGVILGFPGRGAFVARPARLGRTQSVASEDAYGRGPVQRTITAFRGQVRPGNSGGPVVDERGRVMGTVFAQAVGEGPEGGYAVPNRLVQAAVRSATGPVETGPCAP